MEYSLKLVLAGGENYRGAEMDTCAWMVPEAHHELVAARCIEALERLSLVLVLHEGAAEGAALQLELERRIPPGAPIGLVHQRGMDSEYRDALSLLHPSGGHLEVIVSGADPLACAGAHTRIETVCLPLFEQVSLHCAMATSAISPAALVPILAHDWVEYDRLGSPTATLTERLRALDLLLSAASSLDQIDALAERCRILGFPSDEFEYLIAQARNRQLQAMRLVDLESEVQNLLQEFRLHHSDQQAQADRANAIRSSGGEVAVALHNTAAVTGHGILVEDPFFAPIYWSDSPAPPPPSLGEMLGPSRARLVVSQLQVGMPETIRMGAPAQGARLVLRLGEQQVIGYVSLLDSPLVATAGMVETLLWLEPLLLVSCRFKQSTWSLSDRAMSGIVHALCDDGFSDEERHDAAELIGWRPNKSHRVAFLLFERSHTATSSEVVSLRREARRSGLTVGVHGDGLVGLVAEDKGKELTMLISWALDRHQAVGVSELTVGARNTPQAVRQAHWAAQIARETGRSIVRFDDLGIETLAFPGAELGTQRALRPLRTLEVAARNVGFEAIETLRALFACGGNIKTAADSLSVHPNTLRYRIERLASATGIDVIDHDVAFELELALRIETGRRAWENLGDAPALPEPPQYSSPHGSPMNNG